MLGAQILTIVMSSSQTDPLIIMQCSSLFLVIFILRSIFSDMRIATPAFFCFPFAWNIYFPSSYFQSICVFRSEVCFLQTTKWIHVFVSVQPSCFVCLLVLPTKVRLVKPMGFPVVMYGCENQTVKKAEHQRIDAFELWCWTTPLRVPWTARRCNQSLLKEISPGISLGGMVVKLKLQYFSHLM